MQNKYPSYFIKWIYISKISLLIKVIFDFFRNVAETLVSKGLATVVKYRPDDDQRSSHYDALLSAENKAIKTQRGLHGKKDHATVRVHEINVRIRQNVVLNYYNVP